MNGSRAVLSGTVDQIADRASMLRERLARLVGWRRAALACVLGVLATAALPPVYVVPLVFPAFTGLIWLVDTTARSTNATRAAFLTGWWFAFGHFLFGFYWLANALLFDPAQFGRMLPFSPFRPPRGPAPFPAAPLARCHRP